MTKMTKREMYAHIATVNASDAEIVEFCNHEIELLDARKNSKGKGLTKVQKENENVKAVIADVLAEAEDKMTVTEMLTDSRLNTFTNQKISALLRQMIESGKVVKTIEGKKAYFSVAVA
jgi:hypothetical protein